MTHHDKPLAAPGLKSYRYPTTGSRFIMIGAKTHAQALSEANRSLSRGRATLPWLDVWDGGKYVPAQYNEGAPAKC